MRCDDWLPWIRRCWFHHNVFPCLWIYNVPLVKGRWCQVNRKPPFKRGKHQILWNQKWMIFFKVAFIQKGLICLWFLQTDKPNYFPELEFLFFSSFLMAQTMSNNLIGTWSCSECSKKALEQLQVLTWHDLSHLEW